MKNGAEVVKWVTVWLVQLTNTILWPDYQKDVRQIAVVHGLSPYQPGEILFGLIKIRLHHRKERNDAIREVPVKKASDLNGAESWILWARAPYGRWEHIFDPAHRAKVEIIQHKKKSQECQPAHLVGVDHLQKAVVLSIRGTKQWEDWSTNFIMHTEEYNKMYGHAGFLKSAEWIINEVSENLEKLLREYKDYRLVVTGHSLGGAVAAWTSICFREKNEQGLSMRLGIKPERLTCYTFCCPPCINKGSSDVDFDFIISVLHQNDFIPYISAGAGEMLRREIHQATWSELPRCSKTMVLEVAETVCQPMIKFVAERTWIHKRMARMVKYKVFGKRLSALLTTIAHEVKLIRNAPVIELYVPGKIFQIYRENSRDTYQVYKINASQISRILVRKWSLASLSNHSAKRMQRALSQFAKGQPIQEENWEKEQQEQDQDQDQKWSLAPALESLFNHTVKWMQGALAILWPFANGQLNEEENSEEKQEKEQDQDQGQDQEELEFVDCNESLEDNEGYKVLKRSDSYSKRREQRHEKRKLAFSQFFKNSRESRKSIQETSYWQRACQRARQLRHGGSAPAESKEAGAR